MARAGASAAVRIRPARAEDEAAILALLRPICASGEFFCADAEGARDYWFSGPGRQVFVAEAEAEGPILGTSYLRPNQGGNGAHVANAGYATCPEARGRGVARALLTHSLETARATGFRAMQFNFVVSTNTRAIATWQAAGFTILARLPGAFRHPEQGYVDALVMHRPL